MIKDFEKYSSLNEGLKTKLAEMAVYLTLLFNTMPSTNQAYSYEYFLDYCNKMNIVNTNPIVQEVIRDFKQKVINDPKILNKQEVLKVIEETPFVFRNNDKISTILYRNAKDEHKGLTPDSWCTTFYPNDKSKKPSSVIFLSKDANYYDMIHELSHAIEPIAKIDPKIVQSFNFNTSFKVINAYVYLITNSDYKLKRPFDKNYIDYLKQPSEVYSRMNSFKMFLYKNKIFKTPNDEITNHFLYDLMTGKIYNSLSDDKKTEFTDSDFFDLIIFIDLKKFQDVNKYVNNFINQEKNNNFKWLTAV